jgi:hypothetical protein
MHTRGYACALMALWSIPAFAQTAESPKLWTYNLPRGQAAGDSMFSKTINFNAAYGQINYHELPPTGTQNTNLWSHGLEDSENLSLPSQTAGEKLGRRLALEALRRGSVYTTTQPTDPNLAIILTRYGEPNDYVRHVVDHSPIILSTNGTFPIDTGKQDIGNGVSNPDIPDLYANDSDNIVFTRSRFNCTGSNCARAVFRTVWLTQGIADNHAWMADLATAYVSYNTSYATAPADLAGGTSHTGQAAFPSRLIFDQEPALILLGEPVANRYDPANPCASCQDPDHEGQSRPLNAAEKFISWQDTLDY